MSTPAFALGSFASSSFTTAAPGVTPSTCERRSLSVRGPRRVTTPITITNTQFSQPQPGDAGYKPPGPVPKGTGMKKTEASPSKPAASAGKKLPVVSNVTPPADESVSATDKVKRGLDLLREDVLKNAPTKVGIGRQDQSAIMKPMYGEPGYKPAAYETVKVSELGISPFPDDKNAVGNVGGIAAVKKAALEVKQGQKTAAEIKRSVLKMEANVETQEFDIPDYLKPLPEDTPRKGFTWKNYKGR